MKTKTKFYSFAIALLFLGVFFVGIGNAKAETYYDCYSGCIDGGTDGPTCQDGCSYLLNADGESTPYVTDQAKAQCDSEGGTIDPSDGVCRCTGDMVPNAAGNCVQSQGCTPACEGGEICQLGVCVSSGGTSVTPEASTCDASSSCWFYNCCESQSSTQSPAEIEALKKAAQETKVDALAAISKAQRAASTAEAAKQKVATDCASGSVILCEAAKDAAKKAEDELARAIDASMSAANAANAASSIANPSAGATGAGFSLCANGVLATVCSGGGGTPYVAGISTGNFGGGSSGGFGSYGGGSGNVNSPKCEAGFTDVGGVCFPGNTGLSNAPIYVIVSNIFSWLMGLFTTLAVVAFVVSGIQYFMASGDEHMAESAKDNAKNASIGILVGLSGFIIIKAIAAALSGTSYFF